MAVSTEVNTEVSVVVTALDINGEVNGTEYSTDVSTDSYKSSDPILVPIHHNTMIILILQIIADPPYSYNSQI